MPIDIIDIPASLPTSAISTVRNRIWTNPSNAKNSDSLYSSIDLLEDETNNAYLVLTGFFSSDMVQSDNLDSFVRDLTIEVDGYFGKVSGSDAVFDSFIGLIAPNLPIGSTTNLATNIVWDALPNSGPRIYSGTHKEWGLSKVRFSDLTTDSFGIAIRLKPSRKGLTAYVNSVKMSVTLVDPLPLFAPKLGFEMTCGSVFSEINEVPSPSFAFSCETFSPSVLTSDSGNVCSVPMLQFLTTSMVPL